MSGPRNVLLIEDDQDLAQLAVMALEAAGFVVHLAATVDEALVVCDDVTPNVAVVDLQLPGRSGWEFIRHARDVLPDVRLVMYSVHEASSVDPVLSVDARLTKEAAPDELAACVSRVARRAGRRIRPRTDDRKERRNSQEIHRFSL